MLCATALTLACPASDDGYSDLPNEQAIIEELMGKHSQQGHVDHKKIATFIARLRTILRTIPSPIFPSNEEVDEFTIQLINKYGIPAG